MSPHSAFKIALSVLALGIGGCGGGDGKPLPGRRETIR